MQSRLEYSADDIDHRRKFCQETVIENGVEKRHRSQKAVVNCLASPDILTSDEAEVHIINWQSVTDKKVCNSAFLF